MNYIQQIFKIYGPIIHEAAIRHKIPEHILGGLIRQESQGNPKAKSHCGAYGLTQIMPDTAKFIASKYRRFDITNPADQIDAGAWYLSWIHKNFAHGDIIQSLAGYNAGPGKLLKGKDGIELWKHFHETIDYVQKVLNYSVQYDESCAEDSSGAVPASPPPPRKRRMSRFHPSRR
jgi:soluble lytic murein transglycosylase-like protein